MVSALCPANSVIGGARHVAALVGEFPLKPTASQLRTYCESNNICPLAAILMLAGHSAMCFTTTFRTELVPTDDGYLHLRHTWGMSWETIDYVCQQWDRTNHARIDACQALVDSGVLTHLTDEQLAPLCVL